MKPLEVKEEGLYWFQRRTEWHWSCVVVSVQAVPPNGRLQLTFFSGNKEWLDEMKGDLRFYGPLENAYEGDIK